MSMDMSSFTISGGREAIPVELPKATATPALPPQLAEEVPLQDRVEPSSSSSAESSPVDPPQKQQQDETKKEPSDPARQQRFSVLARKEAQLNRERERLKAERAAIEQEAKLASEFEMKKVKAKLNPIEALKDLGLTYEEITEFVMNDNQPTVSAEVQAVRDELEKFRQEQEEARLEAERITAQKLEAEQQRVIDSFRNQAISYINQNASNFEFTIANGAEDFVPEIIEKHFLETGELLSIDTAAKIVEDHFEGIAERVAKAEKFKAKTASASAQQPAASASQAFAQQIKRPATLTNAMTASVSAPQPGTRSQQDRIRAALARLEGK